MHSGPFMHLFVERFMSQSSFVPDVPKMPLSKEGPSNQLSYGTLNDVRALTIGYDLLFPLIHQLSFM